MSWIMVDIEADGPIPGDYSMIEIGATLVDLPRRGFEHPFSAHLRPVSALSRPESLSVSGYTRGQATGFDDPAAVMSNFASWVDRVGGGRTSHSRKPIGDALGNAEAFLAIFDRCGVRDGA